jgi:hypothetical protein
MRSNINILKKKYNIQTDKALLNYLADKECMPTVVHIELNKEVADKPVKKVKEEIITNKVEDIFNGVGFEMPSKK